MPDNKAYDWFGGSVRSGWKIVRLGSVFRERNEPTTAEDLAPLSVTKNGVVEQQESVAISAVGAPKKVARKGDFVINSRSDRKGSAGIAPRDGSVSLINIVLEPKGIYPQFAKYLLTSVGFQEEFYRFGSGIVADLWTTRYSAMKTIQIPLPPLNEQIRIADELDRELAEIDEFIADQTRLLELTTEKFNAELRNLTYPPGVETIPLKRFADIALGKMVTPTDKGGMKLAPYIRAANIQPGGVLTYKTDKKEMWFSPSELSYLKLRKNDVLVVEGGAGFGRSAVLDEDLPGWGFQNSINRVRVHPGTADPYFIDFCIRSQLLFGDLNNLTNQSTIPHLTAEKLKLVKIPIYNLENQLSTSNKISSVTSNLQSIQESIDKSIAILSEHSKSLINKIIHQ